jgi:hypothetical protein
MENTKPNASKKPAQPARKMKVNPESVKDLTPSARTGNHVKGGIPRLGNSGGGTTGPGPGK